MKKMLSAMSIGLSVLFGSNAVIASAETVNETSNRNYEKSVAIDYANIVTVGTKKTSEFRDMATAEIVDEMGIGINLGNTMEATGDWVAQWGDGTPNAYETCWGSPTITKEMIQGYADEGFRSLRIPVAWSNMMEADGTYTINPAYAARVKEIVDWSLDTGMYVIINIHWDGGWLEELPTNHDEVMKRFCTMWTQIADLFKDYNDYLIFECQNEELGWESIWNQWGGTEDQKRISYGYVNEVNQAFVDVIRCSGGNNDKRHLLISGYNTDIEKTCDPLFQMPSDPANRMAISVHYYTPADFCIISEDADWAKARATWGTEEDFSTLNRLMDMMKTNYVDKGIPVIIGEFGVTFENKEYESIKLWLTSVAEAALKRDMCPVLWDTTGGIYNRETCKIDYPDIHDAFTALSDTYAPKKEETKIRGDVNADGQFNISDVVMLQKWLICTPDVTLTDWKAGDLCEDDGIDVFDLCIMKYELLRK